MATYEELDTLVGALKRAAIDSYMCSGSSSGSTWQRSEDYYYLHYYDEYAGGEKVTRPAADGSGGGAWTKSGSETGSNETKYLPNFDAVRSAIDAELAKGWLDIPDPAAVSGLVEAMRLTNGHLALGTVSSDGKVTGPGDIAGNLNLILQNSTGMSGGMITAFKADFLAQLGKAVGGQHAITVILGGALAAQEAMWRHGRQTVADIVVGCTAAFNASCGSSGNEWNVILKVAGYAVAGATIFATGGAATGLAVAALGLTILKDSLPAEATQPKASAPEGDNYEAILSAYRKGLSDLDAAITTEENTLNQNFAVNLQQIRAQKGSYDLDRPSMIDVDDDDDLHYDGDTREEIKIDDVLVDEITGTYMPNVADTLDLAVKELDGATDLSCLMRGGSIGMGLYGPNENYHELRYLLVELLGNLSAEVRHSATSLQLAVEDIGGADTDAHDALEAHHRKMQGENYPDPWNKVEHPPNL